MAAIPQKALIRLSLAAALALGLAVCIFAYSAASSARQEARSAALNLSERAEVEDILTVRAIRPKRDPSFVIAVQQLATVEPYFQAELRSKVAGPIKYIHKTIGDRIARDEVLVEIDVPDQLEDVARKERIVDERRQELRLAEVHVRYSRATVEVVTHAIEQRAADLEQAEATRAYRKKRLDRFAALQKQKAVDPNVAEEEERDYRASEAACRSAALAIKKAEADREEKQATLEAALADVELKQALLDVARKDRDRARAVADYARIRAPFDGVLTERNVDPGDFVQSAAAARTVPLLSAARTDVVTVGMKVPDNDAPFVGPDTEAVIQLDDFPGSEFHARVTRFSASIHDADRTMRVEVDLFNGDETRYRRFVARSVAGSLAPLGHDCFGEGLTLRAASVYLWRSQSKGSGETFPVRPRWTGSSAEYHRLLPGMSGYMRLLLQKFENTYLIPASAVFSRGGKLYISVAENGVARRVPVRVQVSDGRLAMVLILEQAGRSGEKEPARGLTGDEQIIVSRQAEISDGQVVTVRLDDQWQKEDELPPP